MTAKTPPSLTPDERAAILESLAFGVDYRRACGPLTRHKVSVALEASDAAWAQAVKDARAEGDRVRGDRVAEARRKRDAELRYEIADVQSSGGAAAVSDRIVADSDREIVAALASPVMSRDAVARPKPVGVAIPPEYRGTVAADAPSKRASEATDDGAPDWQRIRAEAEAKHGPGLLGLFLWQEERLAARGFHPVSAWWLSVVEGFLFSLKRWLLALVGRGAGKSTMLTRLAVVLALFTPRRVPPGQAWIWPFVSVRPDDAAKRLLEIQAILIHAYGFKDTTGSRAQASEGEVAAMRRGPRPGTCKIAGGTPTMEILDSAGNWIAFVSFASTLGNVSGPNSIGATVDEEEKLERNPAEVVGSLAQTFRARPGIRGIRCSSAYKADGTLVRALGKGDTVTNYVARIGAAGLPAAREGLEAVAQWEEQRGDRDAAARIREHAATLTPESVSVPTWIGNDRTGAPDEESPWSAAQAAVATRIEAEAVDDRVLEGLARVDYWLRENASVVPDAGRVYEEDPRKPFEACGLGSRYEGFTADDRWEGVR